MLFKFEPIFKEKIWGGHKLSSIYHYPCSTQTGEAWGISAHQNGSSIIKNGPFKGLTLRQLYHEQRQFFGDLSNDEFPILVKLIDASDDLSIQVHPDDAYAREHENSLGKTECWYILNADPNTEIIIGHKAKTKAEFIHHFNNKQVESILNRFPIKSHDQFNIYAGTIHAICKGTLLLEIQQSSDITYRLYDYQRLSNGKLRELHINKALDVIKFPDNKLSNKQPSHLFHYEIVSNADTKNTVAHQFGDYLFIMEGKGEIDQTPIEKGDFLMISSSSRYQLQGSFQYAKIQIHN